MAPRPAAAGLPANSRTDRRTVAVVGAGLVGALAAVYLAKRGWAVHLYEARADIRKADPDAVGQGRSINLALSKRAIDALYGTGLFLDRFVLQDAIPMEGRMIHGRDGSLNSQPYGLHGECINSVDRSKLNKTLLDAAEALEGVTLFFEHRLKRVDFDRRILVFAAGRKSEEKEVVKRADVILGCDGAYSTVRSQLMRVTRMNYKQEYIPHGYCELTMPAGTGESREPTFKMHPNRLHIWPRHTFMMIALPNKDCTFTCTLFMPFDNFRTIKTEDDLMDFFRANFPDVIPLIGEESLRKQYFANPKGPLMCVKCRPYHYTSAGLIIGDAAHSMVPFYGQGMNAGFEDVRLLNRLLDEHGVSSRVDRPGSAGAEDGRVLPEDLALAAALSAYTEHRHPDAEAIVDLAMENYVEMRSAVVSPGYLLRRRAERLLHKLFPSLIVPLYTMVSFTTIRYSEARQRNRVQGQWLLGSAVFAAAATLAGIAWAAARYKSVIERALRRR